MKKITLFLIASLLASCEPKSTDSTFYNNIDLTIEKMGSDCSVSNDKFHRPQLCTAILFKTTKEPFLYMELNTCNNIPLHAGIITRPEWLYNHKVGDTVHFDYIYKSRFFKIKQ